MRLIDDALEGGQNGATWSRFTRRPTDLDSWVTQCRMVQERFPQSALSQFPSDFKKAYKQVPAEPSLAGAPAETLSCVPGGPYTILWWKVLPCKFRESSRLVHCVDDVLAVDRKTTIFSGWLVWRVLAACCGWVVPDEKSPLPSQVHRILGATSDLSQTPYGPPTLSIAQTESSNCQA